MSDRMNRRLERVNVASLRVALVATAAFAVVYAIVAALIVVLVTNNLQSQIDNRLTSAVSAVQSGTPLNAQDFLTTSQNGDLSSPSLLAWGVFPDGTIDWSTLRTWRGPLPASALT